MNHIRYFRPQSSFSVLSICHPERSLATSEATRQTQSKDPYHHDEAGESGSFRVVVRFFDECTADEAPGAEYLPKPSREAAAFVSSGRKPWEAHERENESRRDATRAPSTKQ